MDLCDLYTARGLLADQNADGCIDAVQARLLLRQDAALAEQRAAVDIAARLGFETMSLSLPIAVVERAAMPWPSQAHPIVCGRADGATRALGYDDLPAMGPLAAGQGLLRLLPAGPASPQGLLVAGADEAGVTAAAALLSRRLPYLWHVGAGQPTLDDVAAGLRAWLAASGAGPCAVAVTALYVEAGRPGIARLEAEVDLQHSDLARLERLAGLLAAEPEDALPFRYAGLRDVAVTLHGGDASRQIERAIDATSEPLLVLSDAASRPAASPAPAVPLGLSALYELRGGLFADTRGDLQPNRLRAHIVLAASSSAAEGAAACDLAARLGLETLGLRLPLALATEDQTEPDSVHIYVGADAGLPALAAELLDLSDGRGVIAVAQDEAHRPLLLVTGTQRRGTEAALRYLAARAPYLEHVDSGSPALGDVETALREALAGADTAGEAAALWEIIDRLTTDLREQEVRSLDLTALLAGPAGGLAASLQQRIAAAIGGATVALQVQDRSATVAAFDERWQAPWEVERLWELLDNRLLPALRDRPAPHTLELDVRVSEPLEVRSALRSAILDVLARQGTPPDRCHVVVRPTYKQGSSWLLEEVLPRLRALPGVDGVAIRCRRFSAPSGAGWVELPTRWIQELFPVDELLAGELGLDTAAVQYELRDDLAATYEVVAWNRGDAVWRDEFKATFDERPYLAGYPHWGLVHPDTGWLSARADGTTLLDERVPTDRECFWDYYQGTILPRLGRRIRDLSTDRSAADAAPFFERLEIDLTIGEEDRAIGLREERYSPLESLHEDLYFVTLDYCSAVTLTAQAEQTGQAPYQPPWMTPSDDLQGLPRSSPHSAPGLIVPLIHQAGEAGPRAHIRLYDLAATRPTVRWRAVLNGGSTRQGTETAAPLACAQPRIVALVPAGAGTRVEQAVAVVDCSDAIQQAVLVRRLDALSALHAQDLYAEAPARPGLERLAVVIGGPETAHHQTFGPAPTPEGSVDSTPDAALTPPAPSEIAWDALIGYEENNALLRRLDLYPEVHVWQAGASLQGRSSYAVEVMAPLPGPLWSRAKASTYKPTLLINTRHHANETSGTSAALRLVALCATDPAVRAHVQRVNLVLVPFENVDGAVLHEELAREHPNWMLHAGRYNARGLEFRLEYLNDATRYPEARVLPRVYRLWRPDIVTDDHGFPSHEWVQPFGGYANAWFASDWIPRGLIYLYLPYPQGPGLQGHERLALALRQAVVAELNGDAEIHDWNRTWADRFKKYAHQWMPRQFPASYYRDVLVHLTGIAPDAARPWTSWMTGFADVYPAVTAISWITEVADETARGAYHHLCALAHLLADLATLRLLAGSAPGVQRGAEEFAEHVVLSVYRPRPPLPAPDLLGEQRDDVWPAE